MGITTKREKFPFADPPATACPHCEGELYDGTLKVRNTEGGFGDGTFCSYCLGCLKCLKNDCIHVTEYDQLVSALREDNFLVE